MEMRKQATKLVMVYYDIIILCDRHGKTCHVGFSMKMEFDAYLISSTIELTCIQISDKSYRSK